MNADAAGVGVGQQNLLRVKRICIECIGSSFSPKPSVGFIKKKAKPTLHSTSLPTIFPYLLRKLDALKKKRYFLNAIRLSSSTPFWHKINLPQILVTKGQKENPLLFKLNCLWGSSRQQALILLNIISTIH
jgi:hypothetical protein